MYKQFKAARLLGALALATAAIACSNTAEGVKQDSVEMKQDAKEVAEDAKVGAGSAADSAADAAHGAADGVTGAIDNAGRAGDAAMETFDVKAALIADNRVDSSDINVDTDHTTKTVLLKGTVPTAQQKTIAGEIATAKAVGYRVENMLTVAGR